MGHVGEGFRRQFRAAQKFANFTDEMSDLSGAGRPAYLSRR